MAVNSKNEADEEAYSENTVLTDLLGDNPKVKILATLLSETDQDINVTQIAELAGVSRSTVYDHLDDLLELNVVEHTRDVGGSPMYRLNRESDVAEDLATLEWDLLSAVSSE